MSCSSPASLGLALAPPTVPRWPRLLIPKHPTGKRLLGQRCQNRNFDTTNLSWVWDILVLAQGSGPAPQCLLWALWTQCYLSQHSRASPREGGQMGVRKPTPWQRREKCCGWSFPWRVFLSSLQNTFSLRTPLLFSNIFLFCVSQEFLAELFCRKTCIEFTRLQREQFPAGPLIGLSR